MDHILEQIIAVKKADKAETIDPKSSPSDVKSILLQAVEAISQSPADPEELIPAEEEEESISAQAGPKTMIQSPEAFPEYLLSIEATPTGCRMEEFYASSASVIPDLSEFYEERKEVSDAGYDLNFTPLDTVEAQKAMKDWQLSLVLGDVDHANYKVREKIANLFMFDMHFALVLHDLNKVTDDIDFSRVV